MLHYVEINNVHFVCALQVTKLQTEYYYFCVARDVVISIDRIDTFVYEEEEVVAESPINTYLFVIN